MKVLVVNNFVRDVSGVDAFVNAEVDGLAAHGHHVLVLRRDNRDVERASPIRRAALSASSVYSLPVLREAHRVLASAKVDVVHLHNLVPFLTGAVYDACRTLRVPTVQHLHNYRAFCLSSYAVRNGRSCDDCARTGFAACAWHRCYRSSTVASGGLTAARWIDWARGRRSGYAADLYIANSCHTARVHADHGLAQERIHVLHNPADDLRSLAPEGSTPVGGKQGKVLTFVGALIAAKGPWVALDLAAALPEFELRFIGTGEDEAALKDACRRRRLANVTFLGLLHGHKKAAAWAGSLLTVVPSCWQEPYGLVVPESYSLGVPVLATAAGGLAETVTPGETGLHLDTDDLEGAAAQVRDLWSDHTRHERMRAAARAAYEARFTKAAFVPRLEGLLSRAAGEAA